MPKNLALFYPATPISESVRRTVELIERLMPKNLALFYPAKPISESVRRTVELIRSHT